MQKVLRSLIHEIFPYELRVEIDILSRRRDIINEEKQEEIFKLLRKYNITDTTPLGPGTNRYAFKIAGFVVKVATDNDGKIDNMKEFKMAKRLFPHVTKTYEISNNGTLLIAEYIQPFGSYAEMLSHADQIRKILSDFSSVYLIGDVGIDRKNYANWGLRVGSDEPVCLDFAYVYEISSSLFICSKCNANSMLIPDKDFVNLHCSNPACGARYTFEDIRMRIGNDLHRHEIGNLSDEGYLMKESNVLTELTPERSNYLKKEVKKEKTKTIEHEEAVELDNFVLPYSPYEYFKEGYSNMSNNDNVLRAFANELVKGTARIVTDTENKKESEVLFESDVVMKGVATVKEDNIIAEPAAETTNEEPAPVEEPETIGEVEEPVVESEVKVDEGTGEENTPIEAEPDEAYDLSDGTFPQDFIDNIQKAISFLSNSIGEWVENNNNIYEAAKPYVAEGVSRKDFHKTVQNAVFRSLCIFGKLNEEEVPYANKPGTHKVWTAPDNNILYNVKYVRLFEFIKEFYAFEGYVDNKAAVIELFRKNVSDSLGIPDEWADAFKNRLKEKMDIQEVGVNKIANAILDTFGDMSSSEEDDAVIDAAVATVLGVAEEQPAEVETEVKEDEILGEGDTANEEYDYYEDESPNDGISVEMYDEDGIKLLRVHHSDAYGSVCIPFYYDTCDRNNNRYEINKEWDWLTNLVPDKVFRTTKPEYWLGMNSVGMNIKFVLLTTEENASIIAIYYIQDIVELDDDGRRISVLDQDDKLKEVNNVITTAITNTTVSHFNRTISICYNANMIVEESEIESAYAEGDEYFLEDDEESSDANEEATTEDLSDVAAAMVSEGVQQPEDDNIIYAPIRRPKN